MEKFNYGQKIESDKPKIIVLGKFLSVHKGHKQMFKSAREIADKNNYELIVMLFDSSKNNNIYTLEERMMLINQYNVDYFMVFEPNKENFSNTYNDFNEYLKTLNVKEVLIGSDFKYGQGRQGDASTLDEDFITNIMVDVRDTKGRISTRRVIESIFDANFIEYRNIMDHYFFYKGIVEKGRQMGRKLGTPTANVKYPDWKIDLPSGIYFTWTIYKGKRLASITSISDNPTFGFGIKKYETHILDFDEDIYGEELIIEVIEKHRDPIKFDSKDELIVKMEEDKFEAIDYFRQNLGKI